MRDRRLSGEITKEQFVEVMKLEPAVFAGLAEYLQQKDLTEFDGVLVDQGLLEEHVNVIFARAFHHCGLEQRIQYVKQINEEVQKVVSVRKDLEFVARVSGRGRCECIDDRRGAEGAWVPEGDIEPAEREGLRGYECDGDDPVLRDEVAAEAGGSHSQCIQALR